MHLQTCNYDISLAAGGMAGGFFATSIGSQKPFGVDGWRFAFFVIAGISVCTGFLTAFMASDPRKVHTSAILGRKKP